MANDAHRTRVVIVGGGFAGLNAAKLLGKTGSTDLEVVLIDRRNHHLFQPLLYQVATAGLNPADISTPIRTVLAPYRNVSVRMGLVTGVDLQRKRLLCDIDDVTSMPAVEGISDEPTQPVEVPYDYLILACGATHAYFGHDEWEEHAPGLKTLEQATEIRRRVLTAFERAELEQDATRRRELLTFVVVGGGPTGVELAGALGELSRHTLSKDFRNIDPTITRVLLIEGGPRILPAFAPDLAQDAARNLEKLGVTIWTDSRVTGVSERGVEIGDEFVAAATVLWAAGVQASPLGQRLGAQTDRAGRVAVRPDLSLPEHPEVFVVGDQAWLPEAEDVAGVAPAAIQMGRHAARNILADLHEQAREDFTYFDKGLMATVGRAAAVVQSGRLHMSGFMAWLAWCFVHILYLIGFRNRLLVFVQWVWSYFRYKRGARLITDPDWRLDRGHPPTVTTTEPRLPSPPAALP